MASTTIETAANMATGLAAAGLSVAVIHALGLRPEDVERQILAAWSNTWPIAVGFVAGFGQNIILWNDAIRRLSSIPGATTKSNYEYKVVPSKNAGRDDIYVAIDCIDGRIHSNGIRVAGGYGRLGLMPTSVAGGSLIADFLDNTNAPAQVALGYAIGSNLYSTLGSTAHLLSEVYRFYARHSDSNVHFNIRNHWKGCGAVAAASPVSHWAKFIAHKPLIADALAFPNEVTSYAAVNFVWSPIVYLTTGGHVSLTASLMHSEMHQTSAH